MDVDGAIEDVIRGFIAQSILAFLGRYVALIQPLVECKRVHVSAMGADEMIAPILSRVTAWRDTYQALCVGLVVETRDIYECTHAGMLLLALYNDLVIDAQLLPHSNLQAVTDWVSRLRSSDYQFPMRAKHVSIVLSPTRPSQINMHAAVQLN